MTLHRLFNAAALSAAIAIMPAALAQTAVNADDHSCAELTKMVNDAGTLRLNARYHNPNGSENYSERDFTGRGARCQFSNERPPQWLLYAKNGEICQRLNVCLPRSFGR